jgi:hypothetical protein
MEMVPISATCEGDWMMDMALLAMASERTHENKDEWSLFTMGTF